MTITLGETLDIKSLTASEVRKLARVNKIGDTCGLASGQVQCNLLIVPGKYADDFRTFCHRNPVSCPLVGETRPGDPSVPPHLAADCDIRTDLAGYCIYKDGKLVDTKDDCIDEFGDDYVAFLIGCSYSFEHALVKNGLPLRHQELGQIVSVYHTKVPLNASGPFSGRMVISMRPFPADKLDKVQQITKPYARAHGEPMVWGFEAAKWLGIDLDKTDWGSPTVFREGEIPMFWGCGISPQTAVMDSGVPGTFIAHKPGHMLVLDLPVSGVSEY